MFSPPPNCVHQSFVVFLKHGVGPECHLALSRINKHPHGQTGLIKGPVSCLKCVVQFFAANVPVGGVILVFRVFVFKTMKYLGSSHPQNFSLGRTRGLVLVDDSLKRDLVT